MLGCQNILQLRWERASLEELLSTDFFKKFLLTFAESRVPSQIMLRCSKRKEMMALKNEMTSGDKTVCPLDKSAAEMGSLC